MSQSGKSPANVIDSPPKGEEDRSLNPDPTGHEHEHEHEGHPHEHGHEHEHEHEGHEGDGGKKSGPRLPFAHLSPAARAKWKRETRFGIAALLSFVILVTVLIMNKGRANGAKPGEKPAKSPVQLAIKAPEPSEPRSEPPASPSPTPAPTPPPAPSTAPADAPPDPTGGPPAPAESSQAPAGDTPPPGSNADTLLPPLTPKGPEGSEPGTNAGPKSETDKAPEQGVVTTGAESKSDPMPPGEPAPNAVPPIPDPNSGPPSNETPKDPPPSTPANEPPAGVPLPAPQEAPPLATDAAPPLPAPEAETPAPAPGNSPESLLPPGGGPAPQPPAPAPDTAPNPTPAPTQAPAAPAPEPDPTPKPAAEEVPPASPAPPPAPAAAAPAPPEQLDRVPSLTKTPSTNETPLADYPAPDFKPGTGIPIPNAGKGLTLEDDLAAAAAPGVVDAAAGRATSPKRAEEDVVEPVPHIVRRGENFFTISKQHYGSGRYWKALWKANSDTVPAADKLWVGATIRIPLPEELDRSLIEPPRFTQSTASSGTVRRASQSAPPGNTRPGSQVRPSSERELALPVADPFIPRARRSPLDDPIGPIPEVRTRASRPRYPVRKGETLRSIAHDTLGDAHRANDILELNRDILDDPNDLVEGQYLELPEGARVGRRAR